MRGTRASPVRRGGMSPPALQTTDEDDRMGSRSGSGSGNEEGSGKPAPSRYHPKNHNEQGSGDRDDSPPGPFGNDVSSSHQTFWAPSAGGSGGSDGSGVEPAVPKAPRTLGPPTFTAGVAYGAGKTLSGAVATPSATELSTRKYLKPPPKRKGAAQALIWNFMLPYSSGDGQRTVECCILVPCESTGGMRKCGATFKHKMGGSTTNLLKHLRRRHPEEANRCMEERRQQGLGAGPSLGETRSGPAAAGGDDDGAYVGGDIWDGGASARAFSLYCAVDLQPPTVSADVGLMQHLNRRSGPQPADRDMFQSIVSAERAILSRYIKQLMERQRSSLSVGPFCSLQLSTWKGPDTNPSAFVVATVTFVVPSFELRRVGLDVHEFPLGVTAKEVAGWVRGFTAEYFDGLAPNQVYIACTVGDGNELEGALKEMDVPSVPCKLTKLLHAVEEGLLVSVHHAPGQSSTVARLLRKAREVATAITRPVRDNSDLAVLQGAIGKDFLHPGASNPNSLRAVLHLFMTLLRRRSQIMEYLRATGTNPPFSVSQAEWSMLCDAVGALEACAEVERSVPPNTDPDGVTPLSSMLVLLQELQDYMGDSMLFVPELDRDMDSHRAEKSVSALDAGLQALRSNILNKLKGGDLGKLGSRVERLAAILDVSQRATLLSDGEEEERAWEELSSEYRMAMYHRTNQPPPLGTGSSGVAGGPQEASSSGASSSDHHKRKWGGALQERKKQRWMATVTQQLESTTPPPEIETYRTMLQLAHSVADPLAWWSGRDNTSSNATGPRIAQLPLLSQMFAQYHSVDSCSIQASTLLGGQGYRIAGLRQVMTSTCIEDMMYLRLNRSLIEEAAAAQPPSENS